ncbi:hypothetical protein TNCV_565521 [Trichonephila clavipes]|nr:hypothetical protein TNCV_565521 [Trichonephila clavipes]
MLHVEGGFVSKNNVVPFRCPCPSLIAPLATQMPVVTSHRTIGDANACGFQSKVNEAMDVLQTFHPSTNGVEWYEQTPNDA